MKDISVETFLSIMQEHDYIVYSDGELNIVGFRNRFGRPNHFDDCIVIYKNALNGWKSWQYEATTLPGLPYIVKPVNQKGAAILVPGQYTEAYAIGLHRMKYKALIQIKPVKVFRDNTKDENYDTKPSTIEEGLYGINIHKASLQTMVVGIDSAGCQVIHAKEDFDKFISLCGASGQKRFTYTLVEI